MTPTLSADAVTATATATATLSAVDMRLRRYFADTAGLVSRHGPLYATLWAAVRRSTLGGKRFRPALVIDTHRELGGASHEDAVAVGTAVELLHTAFLLHDDVIDGDTMRRGRLNLIGEFIRDARASGLDDEAATAWARSAAILAGDLILHSAQAMVARLDLDTARRCRLLDLLEESVFVTAAGELYDVAFASGVTEAGLDEVLAMTEWKTAHYSFETPLVAGAVLAGAPERTTATLREYGRRVGIAFQLRDDLLGVFGSERVTGKSASSDLRGGKLTVLAAYARTSAAAREFRSPLREGDDRALDRVRDALAAGGGRAFVEDLIDAHVEGAIDVLAAAELPDGLRSCLVRVADHAARRNS